MARRSIAGEIGAFSRARRGPCLCAAVAASLCCLTLASAEPAPSRFAQGDAPAATQRGRAGAPLPPRRPREPQAPASPPPVTEPPSQPPPELPPLDTSTPPPSLPRAPRERMRRCASQWMKLEQEGSAGNMTWRDFATRCLTR